MIESRRVWGVELRVIDVIPEEVIGVDNDHYSVLFWEGAEIGRMVQSGEMKGEGK